MSDQIEEVKQKINIVEIVSEQVTLKKKGRNFVGLCPFHSEKTGSFMVNEELQIYKCFGCGAGGDVFKFLMETEGLGFGEALEKLAERAGVKLIKMAAGDDKKRELIEIHDLATEYYHYLLTKHELGKEAREYLLSREINEKLWKTFRLGYALNEWDGLVRYLTGKKGYGREVMMAAGLAAGGERIYDRFRGRVMFPLLDIAGRVVGFSGRIIKPTAEEAKYINSPETEIYHKSRMLYGLTVARGEIKKKNRAVIVEGELDMISSFAAGVTETVAIKGSALTGEMMMMLRRLTDNFVLALDADAAGEAAMKRSIEESEKLELSIKMVEIVGGKDPDEIARKQPKKWQEMVDKAVPVYEFFFAKAINKWGTDSVEDIGKVVREVVPYLTKIENGVIREVWVNKLAARLGVGRQRVWEETEKVRSGKRSEIVPVAIQHRSGGRRELDSRVIGLMLMMKKNLKEKLVRMLVDLPLVGAVGKLVALVLGEETERGVEVFIQRLPEELRELAQEAYLSLDDEDMIEEKEVLRIVKEWVRRVIREEKERLTEQIKAVEAGVGKMANLDILSQKLVKLDTLRRELEIN